MADAMMPRLSSVGWLGWLRVESRPASPIVFRNRVTTRRLAETAIMSCRRMIFDTAATISGVSPKVTASSRSCDVSGLSSHSRNSPTVSEETAEKAAGSCRCAISRETSSSSDEMSSSPRNAFKGRSASAIWAAKRSTGPCAAMPASWSPERSGVAFASSIFRSSKRKTVCSIVVV